MCRLDSAGLKYVTVPASSEHGHKQLPSIKGRIFLDKLKAYRLLNGDSALSS